MSERRYHSSCSTSFSVVHVLSYLVIYIVVPISTREAIRCCSLANGSCRSACEQISLVSIATNPDELHSKLQHLNTLCHKPYMLSFWECLNETLSELEKGNGWFGRPCCHIPQLEKCKMACLQAQSVLDLSTSCRKSDEIPFFSCLEKQEDGERCCRNAETSSCSQACKEVFATSFTPSKQVRDAVEKYCSQDSHIQQCIHSYIHVTPAEKPYRNMHCCDKSPTTLCRTTCKTIMKTETSWQELIDSLNKGGCGPPLLQNRFWQCLIKSLGTNNEPGGSMIQSEKIGMDSAKLQCCPRASTTNCKRLCETRYGNPWDFGSWNDFDRCQLTESEMMRCLDEVDDPCELGCKGLEYCTNFNNRPSELFRKCDAEADQAAGLDIKSWQRGIINLPLMMVIPLLDITKCHPESWKAIACILQIKPCHPEGHVNRICKSDCIDILNKCVDKSRLTRDQNPVILCEMLSPPGNDSSCISLSTYIVESKVEPDHDDVTHPCKSNLCNSNFANQLQQSHGSYNVCMINRNCLYQHKCQSYSCVPGCRMGEVSQLFVPNNTYVSVPSTTHLSPCRMVCYCNPEGKLEDCITPQPCLSNNACTYEGMKYNHNTRFTVGCNICFCYDGEVTCSQKSCGSGLPCNCQDHYVPVCGANGKTYPSVCLARCAGLTDDQFEFGACYDSDPCSPNSCHPYDRCVPRKRVCLSIRHRSCKQYDCVNMQHNCNQQPKAPVCDTDNTDHVNICWLLQKRKVLAHYGNCMPHCRANGPVCGHNGETYASECAAWAERVSVDYNGYCTAVGSSYGSESRCNGIRCTQLPSEHCTKVFPPGGCCPICGAAIRVLYSQKLSDWSVEATRDVEPVVIQTIAEELRQHVKIIECEVFAYLSLESDIVVLFTAITDSPTLLQVEACTKEAEKVQVLIKERSPTLLTKLPLSFIITATKIEPVTGSATHATLSAYLSVLLTSLALMNSVWSTRTL